MILNVACFHQKEEETWKTKTTSQPISKLSPKH